MNAATTEEMMAMAVLRGDRAAALALADSLCEDRAGTVREIPPVRKITCDINRIRVVCRTYPELGNDVRVDVPRLEQCVRNWLRGDGPLTLVGMTVELYELSEPAAQPTLKRTEAVPSTKTLPAGTKLVKVGKDHYRLAKSGEQADAELREEVRL